MKDIIALITGAASGIGYETARQFLERGATVVGADFNAETLAEASGKLGERFIAKFCDISSVAQTKALADFIGSEFGRLDSLINNAGLGRYMTMAEMEESDYDYYFNILLKGPMFLTKYCIPLLQKSENASITNISSLGALTEFPDVYVYSTGKAAIEKFTYQLVRGFPGIRANVVFPGVIDTAVWKTGMKRSDEEIRATFDAVKAVVPAGRIGKPEDVANCIRWLASREASYVNGVGIHVDGGLLRSPNYAVMP